MNSQQVISKKAYELWEADGRQPGRDLEYWTRAESEIYSARSFRWQVSSKNYINHFQLRDLVLARILLEDDRDQMRCFNNALADPEKYDIIEPCAGQAAELFK